MNLNITNVQNNNIKARAKSKRQNPTFGANIIEPEVKQLIRAYIPDFGGISSVGTFISESSGQGIIKTILSGKYRPKIVTKSLIKLQTYIQMKIAKI